MLWPIVIAQISSGGEATHLTNAIVIAIAIDY